VPADPADFLSVAEMLALESVDDLDDSKDLWLVCEDARARSAVSRSYYAAFRVLKSRLLERREEWRRDPSRFPSRAVHENVKKALTQHLSDKHVVVREMKALLRQRNRSDYEFVPELTCIDVEADLVAAEAAIDAIGQLSNDELDGIALELTQLDAQARRRG
jgi:uncharacterized protein (UPF0332 family)